MTSELRLGPQAQRRLEGAGSDARLRNLQRRFSRMNRRIERPRAHRPWKLAVMCAVTFAGVLIAGLLLAG